MQILPMQWRVALAGVGIVAGLSAPPAHARTTAEAPHLGHAVTQSGGHKAPALAALTGKPSVWPGAAFHGGHLKRPEPGSRLGHLSVHDGVYYHGASKFAFSKNGKAKYALRGRSFSFAYGYGGGEGSLQCVPFARAASGIELKGNAANWWSAAAGVYQRGSRPEPGSVLNFRATGHMRLGHVAVVAEVVNGREIEIDHANWAGAGAYKGGVARGVHVVDVSADNDWSEVRVARGDSEDFGNTYPTYGFIYDRPDSGTMLANARTVGFRGMSEVAEAPRR